MATSTPNPHQVNTSILGMISAVITALCSVVVETAIQGNILIHKSFNVAIHGVSAAEHIGQAVEGRAEIYGQGLVANGVLAERESLLKSKLRLWNLEAQEKAASQSKGDEPKPAARKARKTPSKKTGPRATGRPQNAANSANGDARA